VRAWWSQARWDRALAAGIDPSSDTRLAARARRLTLLRKRRRIADSILSVIEDAHTLPAGMSSEVPAQGQSIREAEPALRTLVNALDAYGPVEPRGVALAVVLVTDVAGPLYCVASAGELASAALSAAAALRDPHGTFGPS
jgi:hypothetical protein